MYEDKTYENLLNNALSMINSTLDKREGSIVYNGVAPAMAELAQLYIGLDFIFNATYISTAPREYLIKRAQDRGLTPKDASAAVFRAEFNIEVPIGTRFSCDDLNFYVSEKIEGETSPYSYRLICETVGNVANSYTGALIPIEYIDGLTSANIVELLIPGEDEEETETFRQRIINSLRYKSFGGNQADYKEKVLEIDGVSAVKVYPVWNGDISPSVFIPSTVVQNWVDNGMDGISNTAIRSWISKVYAAALNRKLTVGGSVKLVIMGSGNTIPTQELINTVQSIIDPVDNAGEGTGLAPIGHVVLVEGISPTTINVTASFTLASGLMWNDVKESVNDAIDLYFNELAGTWSDIDNIVVRISQLESHILHECSSLVIDIANTQLNGADSNIMLDSDRIPIRGTVSNG